MSKKIGRNEMCPCGSGKKYKRCCLNSGKVFNKRPSTNSSLPFFNNNNTISMIKTYAGLSLLPENHGKNIRLEELTWEAAKTINSSVNKPSIGELQTFLDSNYSYNYNEDPIENLFTDLVTFAGGDYLIFPGITEGGSYKLAKLLSAIYNWKDSGIPSDYKHNVKKASLLLLNISNIIAERLGYSRYMSSVQSENTIYLPIELKLEKLKEAVCFTEDEIQQLLDNNIPIEAIQEFILIINTELADGDLNDNPLLNKPIINYNGEYIIASPATLSYALTNFIFSHAKLFDCISLVGDAYHNVVCNYLHLDLISLKFNPEEIPSLTNKSQLNRDTIYRFDDDKLAYVQYIYDGGSSESNIDGAESNQERKQRVINEILALPEYSNYQFMDINLISMFENEFFYLEENTQNSLSVSMTINNLDTFVKLDKYSAIDLWNYSNARRKNQSVSPLINSSFLDSFKVYKERDDSFYLSDENTLTGLIIEPSYSADYYNDAKLLADEHSALRNINGEESYYPVIKKDKYAPIYYSLSDLGRELYLLVEGYCQPIWVSPIKNKMLIKESLRRLYIEMADAISYWLWQCQPFIKEYLCLLGESPINVCFEFNQENRFEIIERDFKRGSGLSELFSVSITGSSIHILIPPEINPYLYGSDNEGERVLLKNILLGFNQLLRFAGLPIMNTDKIKEVVELAAPLGNKKKIFLIDTNDNLLLDPSNLKNHRYIQSYNINVVLDSIVPELGEFCPPVGDVIGKKNKGKLIRDIVSRVLLPKLRYTISQYHQDSLLKRLIGLNESLIQKREDLRIKTPTRIACFVSEEQQTIDLQESLTKLNQTSISVRCLIEHIAAEQCTGSKVVSTGSIDELVAIMGSIINWGSLGDQLKYDLFDIEMGVLPSARIGTQKQLPREIFDPYYLSKSREDVFDAKATFDQVFPQNNPMEGGEVPENLDLAFSEEFGLSFTRICEFINDFSIVAYKQNTPFAAIPKNELYNKINEFDHAYTIDEYNTALEYLCLTNRGQVDNVPGGFDSFDISPWRFNRRLSLMRKPLVAVNNVSEPDNPTIYWGFRHLLSSRVYLNEQCMSNRLRVNEGGPVNKVLGKLVQRRGSRLVESVLNELKDELLIIDSEVPIRPKAILSNDKDIGDIDVLVINEASNTLYSLECKSMAPSRNIKEMVEEIEKLYGSDSKKGWIEKHVERDGWIKNNLDKVGSKYNLDLSEYAINSFIVTQEDMLTPYLITRKSDLPFVTLYNLKENGLNALNK